MPRKLLLFLLLTVATALTTAQEVPPYTAFHPGGQWLDTDGNHIDAHGGNIVYVDTLKTYFWYGEHRGEPAGASCYSSRDLYNWTNEGVVIEKGDIEVFERPKVIYDEKNERYVMWFHYDGDRYSMAELGVAVSDTPTGPFTVQDHFRPNGHESRDIGMYFEPDTRKAYIGYAADHVNRTIRMAELSDDYLSITENDVDIEAHCEGPGILKKDGTFYLLTSQCSGWTPNPATYYTATDILGPYTEQGYPFVGDAGNNSFNSQPCYIFKIPGYRDAYLYMGDRWNGRGRAESQYVFLPITITEAGEMELHWRNEWDLSLFTPQRGR